MFMKTATAKKPRKFRYGGDKEFVFAVMHVIIVSDSHQGYALRLCSTLFLIK